MTEHISNGIIDRYAMGALEVTLRDTPEGEQPFEVVVRHRDYKNNNPIVVGAYPSEGEGREAFQVWIKTMSTKPLPEQLADIPNVRREARGEPKRMAATFPKRKHDRRD